MTTMLIVVSLVRLELPLEIALAPEPDPVRVLAADGSDQSLHKGMRTRRTGDGLDLFDLEQPQIRSPAMRAEQGIVVGGKVPGRRLARDRAIEHPADADAVEIGRGNPKTDDPTGEDVHHHHDPIAFEQNRLDAEKIDAPQAVPGMSDCRQPGGAAVRPWSGR